MAWAHGRGELRSPCDLAALRRSSIGGRLRAFSDAGLLGRNHARLPSGVKRRLGEGVSLLFYDAFLKRRW